MSQLKDEGNQHFKLSEFDKALACYTQALSLDETKASLQDQAVLHRNLAACHLKLNNPQAAATEASLGRSNYILSFELFLCYLQNFKSYL